MFKKNKGITLIILSITLILILILATVSFTTSKSLIKDINWKSVVTNMYVIKGKAEAIFDEYEFKADINILEGERVYDLSSYGIEIQEDDLWYIWDNETIKKLGMDEKMMIGGSNYIVNYVTGEVIFTLGIEKNGTKLYTLSELTQ